MGANLGIGDGQGVTKLHQERFVLVLPPESRFGREIENWASLVQFTCTEIHKLRLSKIMCLKFR